MMLALAVAACAVLLPATPASAARSQLTVLQDDSLLLNQAERRDETLDEWDTLGVDVVKIRLNWRDLSPRRRPSNPSDPAAYVASEWVRYDRTIRAAQQRGMRVFLLLGGQAPSWASKKKSGIPRGVHKPNAGLFKQFVRAAGRRYSGSYAPVPGGGDPGVLPRVTIWSIWNEPNLVSWLSPQSSAPRIYRNLLYAGFDGLNATGHGRDTILSGELLPFARGSTGRVRRRPLEFMRAVACVDSRYRAYRGRKARSKGCSRFRKLPGIGVAHHPYTLAGGPTVRSPHKDDVSISELSRMTRALDKLTRKRRFATRRRQVIWSTEFGFQTDPPDPFASRIKRVPGFMGEAEYLAFRNGRVRGWSQYPFADDAVSNSGRNRFGGFQSGLKFENGRRKHGVYHAFRYPFFVKRVSRSRVQVFGGVRAVGAGRTVTVDTRLPKRKWRRLGTVRTGAQGYFLRNYRASGSKRQFRFRYGRATSRAARAAKR
jgi:hypothetical protein